FYALPPSLTDLAGEPVQAVYGFLSILFLKIAELKPELVAVALDEGRPFREAFFPEYKAGRQEIDPAVARQVERLRTVLDALEVPMYGVAGYEADDVIATLVRQANQEDDLTTVVLSGDRDLFGLIGPRTTILYPTRSMREAERYDAARLHAKWGIRPEQVTDFKALVGDASDNIPGVRGIGEKSATALLGQFDTLDAIYHNLAVVAPARARTALEAGRDMALLSRKLARLVDDVPGVALDREACRLSYDRARVERVFDGFGFNSLRNRLP
ncbi:MAG: 5'-3' exonuclease, partial [Ardenticatenaceae bacterium]